MVFQLTLLISSRGYINVVPLIPFTRAPCLYFIRQPLLNNILIGQPEAIDKYLDFLKAGSSDYPVEVLKAAGVDMLSTQPVDNLLKKFGNLVNEMEETFKRKGIIE